MIDQGVLPVIPVAAFFFLLLSTCRFALNLGLVDRPLAAGLLFGALTGQWSLCLGVAIFFELFWLDLFPAGTYIPPHSLAGVFLTLTFAWAYGLSAPEEIVFPLALSIPLGLLASRIEAAHRTWQNEAFTRLLTWARKPDASRRCPPGRLLVRSILMLMAANFLFFILASLGLIGAQVLFVRLLGFPPLAPGIGWGHLWLAALLGGVLALRAPRAYAVLAAAAVLFAAVGISVAGDLL